jgi:type IV pilus assembly protein PilV
MQNKIVSKNGQTLIEVLVTIVFVSMATIALIRFQNYLAYDNSVSQQTGDATVIAQSQIETLRDFQVLNNTAGYTSYQSIASGSSVVAGTTASYTVTWTVTSNTNPTYKVINVSVSWTDRRGKSQSVTLVSDVAGIQPSTSASIM